MIPSVVAEQLRRGLVDYVSTTFPFANEPFKSSFADYLNKDKSLCLEPYTAIRLPFRSCEAMPTCFDAVKPAFLPYVHQQQAFDRLAGDDGRSTLVATGTGSGKTECFLYPVIDYCYRHRNERGVKALVIYPMNALATDQAERIAKLIYSNDNLRDNVTAGLYVGGLKWGEGLKVMGKENVITDRETMIDNPPDILLTNYKMLDYLLMRPHDSRIWQYNHPDTLKYIAVDEMHTFDGAQGTDLACLLRRLKSKLFIQAGHLCCVGTSATMGGEGSVAGMLKYARDLFGEPFDDDAVIQESRLTTEEFLNGTDPSFFAVPTQNQISLLESFVMENDFEEYINTAHEAFFEESIDGQSASACLALSEKLKRHNLFQSLMTYAHGRYYRTSEAIEALGAKHPALAEKGGAAILDALAALVSLARTGSEDSPRPFLNVQVQLWGKELRRLVASVDAQRVDFDIAINLSAERQGKFLPVINCRDCGQTAWAGLTTIDRHIGAKSLPAFYNTFFGDGDNLVAIYPRKSGAASVAEGRDYWYCPDCGAFVDADLEAGDKMASCPECDADMIPVGIAELRRTTRAGTSRSHAKQYRCPCCGSDQGLAIMGLRGTTESEVMLTQLFATGFDNDVRTLVFSDNVQDASHRAGFFNGRTWKFGLRTAMQEYLHETEERQSVKKFITGFADYWANRLSGEDFAARFIAPNNTWMHEYEHLIDKGKLTGGKDTSWFLGTVKSRMSYEALIELGIRSHIGRTMEKSAAIAVEFDSELVRESAEAAIEFVENEHGITVDQEVMESVVLGVLQQLRSDGAFAEPLYEGYIRKGANPYLLNHRGLAYMPSLRSSGIPRFPLVSGLQKKGFSSWNSPEFGKIAQKCLPPELRDNAGLPSALVKCVLRACCAKGLLSKMAEESMLCSFGINESNVYVTTAVERLICDDCGRTVVRALANHDQCIATPCPSAFCNGRLRKSDKQGLDYYGSLFSGGLRDRIVATEHTGLLSRDDREEVEREFKEELEKRHPWYPNVLSCTPTLEMGIDIGDLSSLIMCGMPPGQAQFLQRAGRAGRRDGNALAVVLANATSHGMYFFDEPREMLEGNVEPPRVFLEAGAVLERQFTAYCIDRWTKESNNEDCVPRTMFKPLQNMAGEQHDTSKFPFNLLEYVKSHTNQLINSFLLLFAGDFAADSDVAFSLRSFALGGAESDESRLHVRVYDAFFARMALRKFYQEQKSILGEMIKELKTHPDDSSYEKQIKELEVEQRSIDNVIKDINNENTFGFMSREGLLPNYAFPEEGANLRVVLRRKSEDNAEIEGKWERETHEYSRAAGSAISEFAPGNTFYANGRHYPIDQIDLSSAEQEDWRLCPDCSHAELITPHTPTKACPKCHSTGWADKEQQRKMLKLSTVISNADYNESMSDDSSDAREIAFFNKQLLVEVLPADVVRAFKVKSKTTDFGFEYVKKATLREINYGPSEAGTAQESSVAGEISVRRGFQVCKKCGKVQIGDKENHSRFCDVNRGKISHEDAIEECLFLYREFETEAIRMLIPETSAVDISEGIVDSFNAAVLLGLKKKFGNVDHLAMTVCEEPVPESGFRKRYLVIYDSVPGGTGYLKQLARNGEEFMSILRLAYDAMRDCTCKDDPNRDGCYRCLYAYRQTSSMGNISRKRAMEVLGAILDSDGLEDVSCLDDVDVSNLFDSVLEKMFIDALAGAKDSSGKPVKCEREIVNGKPGFALSVGKFVWEVEPQVELGSSQGVVVSCKPDFVLWPVALDTEDSRKPVAVFTDGFEYHKNRIADDVLKREAICRSGRYRVWSLSYQDVESAIKGAHGSYYLDLLRIPELPNETLYINTVASRSGGFDPSKESPFSALVWYLGHPNAEEVFAAHAESYTLGMNPVEKDASVCRGAAKHCLDLAGEMQIEINCDEMHMPFAGAWRPGEHLSLYSVATADDAKALHGTLLFASLDDLDFEDIAFQRQWNGVLDLWNLMQFFWGFAVVPKSGIEQGSFQVLPAKVNMPGFEIESSENATDKAWEKAIEEMLGFGVEDAKRLRSWDIPAPDEVGYELDSGEQADLAWLERRICFLTDDLLEDKGVFEDAGWRVIDSSCEQEQVQDMFGVNR